MTSLRYLRLEYNKQVTPVGWQALASYFQSPTCVLKELDLNDNNVDDDFDTYGGATADCVQRAAKTSR